MKNSNPNNPTPNADVAGKRLGLSSVEKQLAQKYAEEIVEKIPDLSATDEIIDLVRESIIGEYGVFIKDEKRIDLIAEGAYETAVGFKHCMAAEEVAKLEKEEKQREAAIEKEKDRSGDKFARLVPRPTINPNVKEDLLDLNLKRAVMGTGHKLNRSIKLGSPFNKSVALGEGSNFTLKTKEEDAKGERTMPMAEFISEKQYEVAYGNASREEFLKRIKDIAELLDRINAVEPLAKERVKQLKTIWKEITNQAEDIDDTMEEYAKLLQLMTLEEDQVKGHSLDKTAGRLYGGYRKLIWANRAHPLYENAFNEQAQLERKLMQFETILKMELGLDLTGAPVEMNRNATSVYSAESTTLMEFENRQKHLGNRIEYVEGLLTATKNAYGDVVKTAGQDAYAAKMQKAGYKANVSEIDRIAKKWGNVENPNLEKLFWHEFGHRVTVIREWQARLPKVARMGQVAYRTETTSICKEYDELRKEIEKLENIQNAALGEDEPFDGLNEAGKFKGLMTILERELGFARTNPFNNDSKVSRMREELEKTRAQLEIKKEEVFQYELLIDGLKKKS